MAVQNQRRVIYDLGSNNGDDLPYYLKKAELVVAVEANPDLAHLIEKRFPDEILAGNLVVENCVVTASDVAGDVDFYISNLDNVVSQFPEPEIPENFTKICLPSKPIICIIRKYGDPYYVKIDLEHYDGVMLRKIFESKIFPPYISAEAHSVDVFALMIALGKYNAFKLVKGSEVESTFANYPIKSLAGPERLSFPFHSAGPFGEDLPGEWMTADNFFRRLAFDGLGWRDIHATNIHAPSATEQVTFPQAVLEKVRRRLLGR